MQSTGRAKPPAGVVFDSDFGNSIDGVLALALLYGFDVKNEVRVAAVTTTKANLKSAAYCDIVARFYAAGGFSRALPVGLADDGRSPEDTPMLTASLAKAAPSITKLNDTAIVEAVIRNALTAQYDGNAMVVLTGPATNLVRLLALAGAKDWIERKVKYLVVSSAGLQSDTPSARKLVAEWPVPIFAAGEDVAAGIEFPAASIEKDFAYAPAHPIAEAYRAYRPMPYDAPTVAMSAVLYAVRPQEGYFRVSEPGTFSVADNGKLTLTPSGGGKHRMLLPDAAQHGRILKTYTEIASAKPVPRMRPRPPVADAKKEEPKKQPEQEPEKK